METDKVCRCCGEKIRACSDTNPNICLTCAQLGVEDFDRDTRREPGFLPVIFRIIEAPSGRKGHSTE